MTSVNRVLSKPDPEQTNARTFQLLEIEHDICSSLQDMEERFLPFFAIYYCVRPPPKQIKAGAAADVD